MKTKFIQLRKTAKAAMIAVLLCLAGMTKVAQAQSSWEQSQNYLFYLVYADYQVGEEIMPDREGGPDAIRRNLLPVGENSMLAWIWDEDPNPEARRTGLIGLAKNEKEGFQVFFREQEKERNLKIVVDTFRNSQNEVLQHTVYWEEFFWPEGVWAENDSNADSLAEALVPYDGEVKRTTVGHNKVFYVELKSTKNQTPGEYTSTVTAYDGEEVIDTRTVIAKVWNFALPENHYAEVVMGLYNRNSGYGSTSSLFTLNGIPADDNGNVVPEDLDEAKRILKGYQSCLLEHGVSTYELPRWLMEDDPKAAELTMADPRRKVFTVPVLYGDLNNSGADFKPSAQQVLQQYKDIVYDNPFLKDKAFFYPKDEPEIEDDFAAIDQFCSVLSGYWPGYHATVPFYSDYPSTVNRFDGKIDILCPHQDMFDPWEPENPHGNSNIPVCENRLQDFMTRDHTWRYYPGGKQNGGIQFFFDAIATVGTMRRVMFWQQYIINSDGILVWNCAYLPNWVKKTLPDSDWIQHGNGDGILLFPSTMFGQDDAAKPVVSLRLKQLAEGIDDYDYLCLAKEFIGPDYVTNILNSGVTPSGALAVFYHFTQLDYLCKIFNRQYDYDAWSCRFMNITRHYIGNALDAANIEHDWGEWQIAVLPDEMHDGMEIRTCSHCGAQESRPITYSSLYRFVGTEDNQWSNLANWANNPETLPTPNETVVIAHDCEIDTDITVFHVVVDEGFNLTVNEGATLVSEWVTTEENAQIIIEDGAQLYTQSEGVQATVKKSIAPQGDNSGWHFISTSLASDVVPSDSNGILSTESNYDLYWFNQSADLEWRNYKTNTFNLENGKGYLYANAEDVNLVFTGTINGKTSKEYGLDYDANAYLDGWNLVGNPYPCEVYVNMSYYTLNNDRSAIEPNMVSSAIAIDPCTGVMVKAETNDKTVIFSKTPPETALNQGSLHITLRQVVETVEATTNYGDGPLTVSEAMSLDKAIISFNEGDELRKFVLNEGNARVYIPQGSEDYAIAYAEKQDDMPLNFVAKENGTYTISVNPENVGMNYLYLIDNLTGINIDLLANPNYTFEAETTDDASRFRLVFSSVKM